jgi:hypothetical protein
MKPGEFVKWNTWAEVKLGDILYFPHPDGRGRAYVKVVYLSKSLAKVVEVDDQLEPLANDEPVTITARGDYSTTGWRRVPDGPPAE